MRSVKNSRGRVLRFSLMRQLCHALRLGMVSARLVAVSTKLSIRLLSPGV